MLTFWIGSYLCNYFIARTRRSQQLLIHLCFGGQLFGQASMESCDVRGLYKRPGPNSQSQRWILASYWPSTGYWPNRCCTFIRILALNELIYKWWCIYYSSSYEEKKINKNSNLYRNYPIKNSINSQKKVTQFKICMNQWWTGINKAPTIVTRAEAEAFGLWIC